MNYAVGWMFGEPQYMPFAGPGEAEERTKVESANGMNKLATDWRQWMHPRDGTFTGYTV